MKKTLFFFLLLAGISELKAQKITLKDLLRFSQMEHSEIARTILPNGWSFYYTKRSQNFISHIYYHTAIIKNNPSAPSGKEVLAKYWLKKIYSTATDYTAIDYTCRFETYNSLLNSAKSLKLQFINSGSDGKRSYDSYLDGKNKIDFIKYQDDSGDYGIIIHLNHNQF